MFLYIYLSIVKPDQNIYDIYSLHLFYIYTYLFNSNGISLGNAVDDGSGTIWLDDMGCTGSESKLKYCSHAGWGIENCDHAEDVGVLCNNLNSPGIVINE